MSKAGWRLFSAPIGSGASDPDWGTSPIRLRRDKHGRQVDLWCSVDDARDLSAALEQAIIHATGDPIQGALARIRGALETLREAGMGEMGEAYVIDALDKMGHPMTKLIDKGVEVTLLSAESIHVTQDFAYSTNEYNTISISLKAGNRVYGVNERCSIEYITLSGRSHLW